MAETVKKAKSLAKTTKSTEAKVASATKKAPAPKAKKAPEAKNKIHLLPASHEQIAQLAHKYWAERGHQNGHAEEDWFRAEQELRGKAS